MIRLDRFLSNATGLTRSQAQRALRAGRVVVDGETVKQGAGRIRLDASVLLDGEPVAPPQPRYLMLNKPQGVVCATEDPSHRTAIDLLELPNPAGLHFAGRLDIDATGLVLITDDGQWSHRITAPGHHCDKRYRVGLQQALSDEDIGRLQAGLLLRGEKRPTRPARLERLAAKSCAVTIDEGRYHQVKRMFAALGNRVLSLHREAIGALVLDAGLAPGQYRTLRREEISLFH